MQVDLLKMWAMTQVATLMAWLAGLCGLEVVRSGWRQIPAGHCDFDPALAEHFKKAGMRNGKHINMAVNYAVIAKWNRSNAKRRDDARTYGSDSYYARNYAEVDRKTWARHMDELAALGLVIISQVAGKPAYEAVAYQFVNNGLLLGENSHAQGGGHGDHVHGHDGQGGGHDAHHQYRESKHSSESALDGSSTSPTARDDGDDILTPSFSNHAGESKKDTQEVKVIHSNLPSPTEPTDGAAHTPSPRSAEPPSPHADLKAFFTGCDDDEVKAWVERHGADKIYGLIKAAVGDHKIKTPVGFVRWQLESGRGGAWTMPKLRSKDENNDWQQDASKYISGKYADIIQH